MVSDPGSDEIVNWVQRAFRYIRREWPNVKAVKGPFLGLLAVGVMAAGAAAWIATRSIYVSDIESLNRDKSSLETTVKSLESTITQQREYLADLRFRTKSDSNPEAIKKIEDLQKELTASRAWPAIEEKLKRLEAIAAKTNEIKTLIILPMKNHYPADSLGHKLLTTFRGAGWKEIKWSMSNFVPPNTKGIYVAVPEGTDSANPPPAARLLKTLLDEAGFATRPIAHDSSLNNFPMCKNTLCIGIVVGERVE